MPTRRTTLTASLAAGLLTGAAPSAARAPPAGGRPLRLIVPFPPGGTTDTLARMTAERMAALLGQKAIGHTLDVKPFGDHDWPVWREMFPQYLSTIG